MGAVALRGDLDAPRGPRGPAASTPPPRTPWRLRRARHHRALRPTAPEFSVERAACTLRRTPSRRRVRTAHGIPGTRFPDLSCRCEESARACAPACTLRRSTTRAGGRDRPETAGRWSLKIRRAV